MQKIVVFGGRIIALLLLVGLLPSCKKDIEKKPFNLTSNTFYRISPIEPVPLVVNEVTYVSTAFFPGGGPGTASYIGEMNTYFNQQVYSESAEAPPLGSVAAPVTDIPSYPLLVGPLALIQAGDFTDLASIISSLRLPESIHGKIVSTIIYNSRGDAVFLSAISGAGSTFPISETVVGFNGKALITGGRGRFANAIGEIDYEGRFSVVNPNDANYNAEGWIDF